MLKTRQTKYTKAVEKYFIKYNHTSNHQALDYLKDWYPNLTATTVHRITERMVKNHGLKLAPLTINQVKRFDSNLTIHDHFHCRNCDSLRDINLPNHIIKELETLLNGCRLNGSLTISGVCQKCIKNKEVV